MFWRKIVIQSPHTDFNGWSGALTCLYQLVKNYEYKKSEERAPLNEAMNLLLPRIYQLMVNLMNDSTEQSVLLQKQILKIYHALTQFQMVTTTQHARQSKISDLQKSIPYVPQSLDLITQEIFSHWMEICRQVVDRPVPDSSHVSEEDRPDLPWWKVKKWALHILARMFERYGSPGNVVSREYQSFAEWYLPTFTNGILNAMLKVLDQYRNNIYVSPRVLTEILNYIKTW